ncbi:type 1 glutamine amidotransferase domain-containing protein [Enterococcus faecalis]|uniref:type 1 glutamine amidotransferase domain-containing protein n=1 Tax=Enterococcus faecalis TaxID=1351 RepID=UPI003A983EF5
MKKILVVLTNVSRYHGTEEPTGLWLGEATEFVEEVTKAGFSVDYVSPQGGYVPLDPRSMKYVDSSIMAVYESADFQERALAHSLSLEEIDPDEYAAIYFTGDHGVMWDFPDNPQLQAITRSLYEQGKYLTSVCHGIAGLLNVKDASGNYLIADKTITGFTTAEEILAMKKAVVPFLNETIAKEHGATFAKKRPYKEFAYQDGRIITGQNPFSVRAVARLLIQQLSK